MRLMQLLQSEQQLTRHFAVIIFFYPNVVPPMRVFPFDLISTSNNYIVYYLGILIIFSPMSVVKP